MNKLAIIILASLFSGISYLASVKQNAPKTFNEISATLSGAAFVTTDLDASVKFYSDFLGFREYKRMNIDSPAGMAPFGVTEGDSLEYVAMLPKVWSKENPNFPGLNFIEIATAQPSPFSQNAQRAPISGEIMKAYAVTGLETIEKKMKDAHIPIITPLAPSATGKSMTLTVLDPNGIRVQMYEYIK